VFSILGEDQFLNIASVTQKSLEKVSRGDQVLKDKLEGVKRRQPKATKQLKADKAK
jgi:hypothetical protein